MVEAAARLAKELHKGQVDKAGVDYFEGHLTFVASLGKTWQEKTVGYLHDASEDTPHSVEQVIEQLEERLGESLSSVDRVEIICALELLNHNLTRDREEYIKGIGLNHLATKVKLNDLTHNMDLSRLPSSTEKDLLRLERYKREYVYLSSMLVE